MTGPGSGWFTVYTPNNMPFLLGPGAVMDIVVASDGLPRGADLGSYDPELVVRGAELDPEGAWDPSWAQVFIETGAGQGLNEDDPMRERRDEIEQQILANLLRLNHARAGA